MTLPNKPKATIISRQRRTCRAQAQERVLVLTFYLHPPVHPPVHTVVSYSPLTGSREDDSVKGIVDTEFNYKQAGGLDYGTVCRLSRFVL
jgi:hypothetical protein